MKPLRGTLPGAENTLFGGYGPFVAVVVLILAMALLAPTVAPEREVTIHPGRVPVGECGAEAPPGDRRSFSTDGCRK